MATLPPHEESFVEFQSDPSMLKRLEAAKAMGELPARYSSHPLVISNPDAPVVPYVLYCDGIKFERHDGVFGDLRVQLFDTTSVLCGCIAKKCTLQMRVQGLVLAMAGVANGEVVAGVASRRGIPSC